MECCPCFRRRTARSASTPANQRAPDDTVKVLVLGPSNSGKRALLQRAKEILGRGNGDCGGPSEGTAALALALSHCGYQVLFYNPALLPDEERSGWMSHVGAAVDAIIFVASLADYDKTASDNDSTHRMDEALAAFDEAVNSPGLKGSRPVSILLILNKVDLFDQMLRERPLKQGWPRAAADERFVDDNDKYRCLEFVKECFQEKCPECRIFSIETCLTNTEGQKMRLEGMVDVFIQTKLSESFTCL